MTVVAGFVRVNRPYFFTDADGDRIEFPSFGIGSGDLIGDALAEYQMYVTARQIEGLTASIPENTDPPTITGTAQVGVLLTASDGTWTAVPAPVFTYQWEADGVAIVDATDATYTPVVGDIGAVITVVVTATNTSGSGSAESAATEAVIAA